MVEKMGREKVNLTDIFRLSYGKTFLKNNSEDIY
jgi:hypothetical protein